MNGVRYRLSALWVALMLSYLLGDVLRIFSGDFDAAAIGGVRVTSGAYLGMAVLFTVPIAMGFLSITLPHRANRRSNLLVAVAFFVINLVGLPTYPSTYDKFLNVVGLVFNLLTLRYAWNWRSGDG